MAGSKQIEEELRIFKHLLTHGYFYKVAYYRRSDILLWSVWDPRSKGSARHGESLSKAFEKFMEARQ